MRFFTTLRVELVEEPHHPRAIDHAAQFAAFSRQRTAIYQPLWRWQPYARRIESEAIAPRLRHEDLHRYRVGFQTVGQTRWLWAKTPLPAEVSYSVAGIDHGNRFALFGRGAAATITASSGVVESPGFSIVPFDDEVRQPQHSLFPFRQFSVAPAVTQPFWIWQQGPEPWVQVDETRRPQPDALFALRGATPVAPQAGQPWWMWQGPETLQIERVDVRAPKHDLFALRAQIPQPAQPWFIYRTAFQLPLAPLTFISPRHDLMAFRQTAAVVVPTPAHRNSFSIRVPQLRFDVRPVRKRY